FKPIVTNVPGIEICELLPLQATIADKLSIVRNMKFNEGGHNPHELYTGFGLRAHRPAVGSVVSRCRKDAGMRNGMPAYIQLHRGAPDAAADPGAAYLGGAYQPFIRPFSTSGEGL